MKPRLIEKKNSRLELILTIYIALKPIYISKTGSVQIADIFLALATLWIIAGMDGLRILVNKENYKWIRLLALATVYVVIVNVAWFVYSSLTQLGSDTQYLTTCLYYVFNLMAVYVCFRVYAYAGLDALLRSCANGCFVASIVCIIGIMINLGTQYRNTGFFRNPNQLGFFALIILTYLLLFRASFTKPERIVSLVCCVIAVLVSLSKAAFVSMFVVLFCYVLFVSERKSFKSIFWRIAALAILLVGLYIVLYSNLSIVRSNPTLRALRSRLSTILIENDSALGSGRGYDRIFEMHENFLWGMGEGGYYRFATMPGKEVHSTYANVLVSYGLIGTVLYLGIFIMPFGGEKRWTSIACMSGIIAYCFTHNGVRNTVFWILLSIIWLITSEQKAQTNVRN